MESNNKTLKNLSRWNRNHQAKSNGFTLIELLVVITIITILIAILLPALAAARKAAQAAACMSNQRQVMIAVTTYCNDHYDGKMMSAFMYNHNPPTGPSDKINNTLWPNRLVNKGNFKGGYLPSMKAVRCPSDTNPRSPTAYPSAVYTLDEHIAYGMREYIKWNSGNYIVGDSYIIPGVASSWPIMADSVGTSSNWNGAQSATLSSWGNGVQLRHQGAANIAFADGHCAAMKARALQALPSVDRMFNRTIIKADGSQIP